MKTSKKIDPHCSGKYFELTPEYMTEFDNSNSLVTIEFIAIMMIKKKHKHNQERNVNEKECFQAQTLLCNKESASTAI